MTSSASNAPISITVWITTAPARIRSPRSGLMPGTSPRSSGVMSAKRSTRSSSALRSSRKPWTPNDGLSAASSAAAPRLRTVPPMPARRAPSRPASGSQPAVGELIGDVRAQRLELLALDLLAGQEALGHAHGAERPRARVARLAALDVGQLHRAAAEVERDAVGERRRVDRGEVAVARLVLGREHLDVEARALARRLQEAPRGSSRRGSPRSRPAARRRCRWRGRSARTARSSRAPAPSAPAAAPRRRRAPRRRAPPRGSRPCAATSRGRRARPR